MLQLMVYPRSPEPNQRSLFGGRPAGRESERASEGQSFHYGSLSAAAATDRQSSKLGLPLRNVFLPAPSQSVRNLYILCTYVLYIQDMVYGDSAAAATVNFRFLTFFFFLFFPSTIITHACPILIYCTLCTVRCDSETNNAFLKKKKYVNPCAFY